MQMGVNRVMTAPFLWQRLMWILIVLFGAAATVVHLGILVDKYFSYEMQTTVIIMQFA